MVCEFCPVLYLQFEKYRCRASRVWFVLTLLPPTKGLLSASTYSFPMHLKIKMRSHDQWPKPCSRMD